jgi:hypothetical protein
MNRIKNILSSSARSLKGLTDFTQVNKKRIELTAGNLKNEFTAMKRITVTNLTLSGTIDARDVQFIRENMPVLSVLDLSGVTIEAYTGTEGTEYGSSHTYPANEMPDHAFYNNQTELSTSSLVSVILPSGLTSIGNWAFKDCDGLTGALILPSDLTSIGYWAFAGCSGLTSISFPSGLQSIEYKAFYQCIGLESIEFPLGLTFIGDEAFEDCSGLTEITNLNPISIMIDADVFTGVNKSTCALKVPTTSVLLYQAIAGWKEFMISRITENIEKE